tara:strand:- start:302 stop:1246 length:945 start_codon:yes stop_codon:yes gene_type:complete
MNIIIVICLIAVVFVFIIINRTPKVVEDPILDEVSPRLMQRLTNEKINVFTYCNDREFNFKMSWRYPQLKYDYTRPFEYLCIQSLIRNMERYDVNIVVLNSRNVHSYLPDFPITFSNDVSKKKTMDLLGAYILERYGGIWISPYTVVLNKDISNILRNVRSNDIVTFGTSINVDSTTGPVNNLVIGARLGSPVIQKYKSLMESFVSSNSYKYLYNHVNSSPEPLQEAISQSNPSRKHYGVETDGSYNINSRKIHIDEYFGKMPLQFLHPSRVDFISIPYEELETDTTYMWIHSTPVKEMIQNNIAIVEILKRQL